MVVLVELFCRRSGGIWSSTVAGFYARLPAVDFLVSSHAVAAVFRRGRFFLFVGFMFI